METMSITSNSRMIDHGERLGLTWEVWMQSESAFGFTVKSGHEVQHTSPAEFPNAGRAGVAAARWIDECAQLRYPDPNDADDFFDQAVGDGGGLVASDEYARDDVSDEPADDFAFEIGDSTAPAAEPGATDARQPDAVAGGWHLFVSQDKRHDYQVDVVHPDLESLRVDALNGVKLPEFGGYREREQALDEARAWAEAHPLDAEGVPVVPAPKPEADYVPPGSGSLGWPGLYAEGQGEPVDEQPTSAPTPAPAPRKAESARPAPARRQPPEVTSRDWIEATELARNIRSLTSEIEDLEDEIKVQKDDLKAKKGLRELHAAKLAKLVHGLHTGASPGSYQPALFGGEAMQEPLVDVEIGKGAVESQAAADRLQPAEQTWVCNAVEHTLVAREIEPGRWRAWLKGHTADTEGFGESRKQAIEACQARASIVFADCEPGEVTPSADAGPVADADVPKAPRKSKPKLKGKSAKQVQDILRASMSLSEAAREIDCTDAELEDWARECGIQISRFLAQEIGADEPAPAPKAKAKRGGKSGKRGARRSK